VKIRYRCSKCGGETEDSMVIGSPPPSNKVHEGCGGVLTRLYGDRHLDRQEDTVSAATQTMLYSKNPSGKDKTVL